MKTIQLIQTFDGVTHSDYLKAKRYLERLYANEIARLSHRFIGKKLTGIAEVIDSNLDVIVKLKKIKDDMNLVSEEDDRL